MSEMKFLVTDSEYRRSGVEYVYKTLARHISAVGGSSECGVLGGRVYFVAYAPDEKGKYFRSLIEDKLSDVIAVNYKYDYFKKYIRVSGLKDVEYELLLSALISADIEDDKRYARSRLGSSPYALDGSFFFTMKALTEKWREIVGYIPTYFAPDQLKEFVSYIVCEKKGGRVYVMGSKVYDVNYNLLNRAYLTGGDECKVIKEIILSSSGEVELASPIPERDEYYLKEFFGDKIFFGKGYFC